MSRDSRLYLVDIIECCDRIREYVNDHTFETFYADSKTIDAVARNLEIIGEAVKGLPTDILATRPEIVWSDVARFRDVIAHQYFRVKLTVIWDVLENELGPIRKAASDLLNCMPQIENQ